MTQRFMHIVLLLAGVSLGVVLSAYGDTPAPFFKRDIAKCFYCDESAEVKAGLSIGEGAKASLRRNSEISNTSEVLPQITGLDPKAPIPFQNLVKTYEAGNVNATYKAAKAWVQYQDKILKRTSELAALVKKAKKEVEAEAALEESTVPEVEPIIQASKPIRLVFFFDSASATSEAAARELQAYYEETLADPTIEVIGVPSSENSVEDLKTFKLGNNFSFPLQFNKELENEFEIESYPLVLGLQEGSREACRLEGSITTESLNRLVESCRTVAQTAGRIS